MRSCPCSRTTYLQAGHVRLDEDLYGLHNRALHLLHPLYGRRPELPGALVVALQRKDGIIMVEQRFRNLLGRCSPRQVGVDEVFQGAYFICQAARRLDVAVQPPLDDVQLLSKVNDGPSEGGTVEGSFL